jgi:hypothetical protein
VVTYNNWGIANDPSEYDQPERFWPERFLDEDLDKFLKGHLGFGAGELTLSPQAFAGSVLLHAALTEVCVKVAGLVSPITLQPRVC